MKNFRKFISSNKQNNLRLFFQISIVALVGIMGLFLWQPSAQMQDSNYDQNRINEKEHTREINNSYDECLLQKQSFHSANSKLLKSANTQLLVRVL